MADIYKSIDISVVVTTYNDSHFLENALVSILAQTLPATEIILIDDGSNDGSDNVLFELTTRFPAVRLVRTRHLGLASARNHGLGLATSDYIAFLDADDIWLPDALAGNARCFASNPGAGLVYGAHTIVDTNLRPIDVPFLTRAGPLAHNALLRENVIGMHGTVLYNRRKLAAAGGFDPAMKFSILPANRCVGRQSDGRQRLCSETHQHLHRLGPAPARIK